MCRLNLFLVEECFLICDQISYKMAGSLGHCWFLIVGCLSNIIIDVSKSEPRFYLMLPNGKPNRWETPDTTSPLFLPVQNLQYSRQPKTCIK